MNPASEQTIRSATARAALDDRPLLTTRPQTFAQRYINSATVWLALMALWSVADLLLAASPSGGRPVKPDPWTTHLAFTVLGLASVWFAHRTGFPAAWDSRVPASRRLLRPALAGLAFGLLAVLIEVATRSSAILAEKMGSSFNVDFPGSLWVYSGGAVVWEFLFRLLPVPLLLWLVSSVALRGRGQEATFWALAALTSAIEPLVLQGVPLLRMAGGAIGAGAFAAYAVHSYALNFTAAVFFRRYGLLAAVLVRLAYYLVWHVAYGYYLQSQA